MMSKWHEGGFTLSRWNTSCAKKRLGDESVFWIALDQNREHSSSRADELMR